MTRGEARRADPGPIRLRPIQRGRRGGHGGCYSFVKVLRQAGPTPTRTGLLTAVSTLTDVSNPFLVPGVQVRLAPGRRFPVTQVLLVRRQAGRWVPFGGIQSAAP